MKEKEITEKILERVDIKKFFEKLNFDDDHINYNPNVIQENMPCILSVDKDGMVYGIISTNKETYFSNPTFMKNYNSKLREIKLKRILKK